jgi:hypothetical protein
MAMKRRALLTVVVLAAASAGYCYWSSDERQIRRLLDNVAAAVSQDERQSGVGSLAEITSLTNYLAADVAIDATPPATATIAGASEVVSTVGRLRTLFPVMQLSIVDVEVGVALDGAATAHAAATLTMRNREGEEAVETRTVVISLVKREGRWVIGAVKAVRGPEPAA